MRFTRFLLRNRLQKVRQASHFKNLYFFLKEKKSQFLYVSSICFGLYCINKFYFRKYKGLNKLSQRFSTKETLDSGIIRAELNYFNILFNDNQYPWAILFPKTLEETQKIIKYAKKYGLSVENENIDHLESLRQNPGKPYIVINQKNMNSFVLNEESRTITIGTGLTVKEINEKLIDKGFYLPINNYQKNMRVFELINHDNADIVHNKYNSIAEFINSMNVVLPNAEVLCTNLPFRKTGFGVSLNEIFIGSNSTLGISTEATLKVLPIPKKVYKVSIRGDLKEVSGKMFDFITDIKNVMKDNEEKIKQIVLKVENETFNVELLAFSKIYYEKFFFKYFQELEIKEKKLTIEKNSKKEIVRECIKHENRQKEEIFRYKYDGKEFINLLINTREEYLNELINLNKNAMFSFSFNLLNNNYALDVIKNKENWPWSENNDKLDELNKNILNYIINRNGILINYYDKRKMIEFKSCSKLIEFGKNNLLLQHELKNLLDPTKIFINDHFHHEILEK